MSGNLEDIVFRIIMILIITPIAVIGSIRFANIVKGESIKPIIAEGSINKYLP